MKLKRNGWHLKLQRWVLGDAEEMKNLCPYFWLTIFCIVTSPIALVVRILRWINRRTLLPFIMFLDEKLLLPFEDWLVERMDEAGIADLYEKADDSFFSNRLFKRWQRKAGKNWYDKIVTFTRIRDNEKIRRLNAQRDRDYSRLERNRKIASYLAKIGIFLAWTMIICVVVLVGFLLKAWWDNYVWSWDMFYKIVTILGFFIVVGVVGFGLGKYVFPVLGMAFKAGLRKFCSGLSEVFGFFYSGFKMIKENYCPGVEWYD